MLLGGWLGVGLPSWGKVETHLNWVNLFERGERLDGGANRTTAAARSLIYLIDAWSVEHHCCLGCFLRQRLPYVVARAIQIIGADEHDRLGDAVLLVVVSLLEATLDGDDPL